MRPHLLAHAFPLIVAAGLSFDDELAEAHSLLSLELYIGVAATALLIALNRLLVREIRRAVAATPI